MIRPVTLLTLLLFFVSIESFSAQKMEIKKPRIIGLTFKDNPLVLKPYLKKFKGEAHATEFQRLSQLIYCKENLSELLGRTPFYPKKDNIVKLKKHGKFQYVKCIYIKANGLQVNLKTLDGELVKLHWSDIPSETIMDMFMYYAKLKIKYLGASTARVEVLKSDLADFALRMALFADWNGWSSRAKKCAALAIKYKPSYEAQVKEFIGD